MSIPSLNTVFRIKSHGGGGHYLTVTGNAPLANNRSLYLTSEIASSMQLWKVIASGSTYKIVSCTDESFALNYYWTNGYGDAGACDIYKHSNNSDANILFDEAAHYTTIVYRIKQADTRLESDEAALYMTPSSWESGATVSWETNDGGDVVQYWLFEEVSIPTATVYASITSGSSGLTTAQQRANATCIYNYLRNAGFTKNAACGVLGNIQAECGFNPGAWEKLNNLSKGFGLVQWTPATKFLNYAYNNNILTNATAEAANYLTITAPQTLVNAELDCIIWCCTHGDFFAPSEDMQHSGYSMTFSSYKASTLDAYTLAIVFHDHFERSNASLSTIQTYRATYADNWYNYFN